VSLSEVRPAQGFDDMAVFINVLGSNLQSGAQVSLGATALQTIFISTEHLLAKVPAGLTPGEYDVTVTNPDSGLASLPNAYTVLDASSANGDLRAGWYGLWADPPSPQEGKDVYLGLNVERVGGSAGTGPFPVRFYSGTVAAGHVIGDGHVAGLGKDDQASTNPVYWGQLSSGRYTLSAVIDPDNIVPETDETNKTVQRTITIRPATDDTTPPTINSLEINGGASQVTTRNISLEVSATDDTGGSGLGSVLYVELHYIAGARLWVPVQWTEWLDYHDQPHSWTLHPSPGLRYIQTWATDKVGNISATSVKALINYVPPATSLAAGEINVYRQLAQAGQCLVVRVTPLSGDPDLYVWPPDYQPDDNYWYSLNGPDQVDAVTIPNTEAGVYQIEVEGASEGEYQLEVLVGDTCPSGAGEGWVTTDDKTTRTEPLLSPGSEPPGDQAVPDPPSQKSSAVYLPLLMKGQ